MVLGYSLGVSRDAMRGPRLSSESAFLLVRPFGTLLPPRRPFGTLLPPPVTASRDTVLNVQSLRKHGGVDVFLTQ